VRGDNSEVGADLCGANPEIRTGDTWRERGIDILRGAELPRENAVSIELVNVASVRVEVDRAGFSPRSNGTITISSDGATTVTLVGLEPKQDLRVGFGNARVDRTGRIVLVLEAGTTAIMQFVRVP
jgi:hypothetical protein